MQNYTATSRQIIASCRNIAAGGANRPILIALSGGPDSMALFRAMIEAHVRIEAAHCNFHLRGEESNRDSRFVEEMCIHWNIPLHHLDVDTAAEALPGESTEMTCRRIRYDWFRKLRDSHSFYRIATGHNADDNIETFFLNTLRGSGLVGLKAMVADTGEIIRPLLRFSRRQIMQFLSESETGYITDSTNLESDYRRNFLRNDVLPLIESRWEGMRTAIGRTIEQLQSDERLLTAIVNRTLGDNPRLLTWDVVNDFPEPRTLLFRFLNRYGGSTYTAEEVERSLPRPRSGKRWRLAEGCNAVATATGLEICFDNEAQAEAAGFKEDALKFEWEEHAAADIDLASIITTRDNNVAWLPYPPVRYELRPIPPQARIHPFGMRGSQAVSSIVREAKLSLDDRRRMRVLVDKASGKVIWIPGIKRSRFHLLDGSEEKVYSIRLTTPIL